MKEQNTLHQLLEHVINGDEDAAAELFHKFVIRGARQIHENLMAEDDSVLSDENLSENDFDVEAEKDAIDAEEAFGDGMNEADDEEAAPEGEEMPAELDGEESMDDAEGMGDDFGGEGEELSTEDRVMDLEAEIAALKAQFEELTGESSDNADDMGSEEMPAELDGEEPMDDVEGDMSEMPAKESFMQEETVEDDNDMFETIDLDEFEDIAESALSELETISSKNSEDVVGAGTGANPKVTLNKTSTIPGSKVAGREGGEPIKMKNPMHSGYNMEKAPAVKTVGKFKNTLGSAMDPLKDVPAKGDSKAMLNSKTGMGAENNTSPISGKSRVSKVV